VGGKLTFFGIDYGKSVNWEMKDADGSIESCTNYCRLFISD
jgi:hypothetical protein